MSIYVMRHGETLGNIAKVLDGRRESPLSENGKVQAKVAGEFLSMIDFHKVFTSPLSRAIETAKIATRNKYSVNIENRLIERSCGEFEGLPFDAIDREKYWNYYDDSQYISVEPIKELFDRVHKFLDELKKDYGDKDILIVTHNGVTKAIKCYFEGIPEDGDLLNIGQQNCEIRKYDWR